MQLQHPARMWKCVLTGYPSNSNDILYPVDRHAALVQRDAVNELPSQAEILEA
jgi:hypothetical protein